MEEALWVWKRHAYLTSKYGPNPTKIKLDILIFLIYFVFMLT